MDVYKAMDADVEEAFLPGNNHVSFESKDKIPAAIFLANVGAVAYMAIVWGGPNVSKFDFTDHKADETTRSQAMTLLIVSLGIGLVGAVLSALWLQVLQLYASRMISMTLQVTAASLALASMAGFMEGGFAGRAIGFLNIILSGVVVMYYFNARHRIPFAAANLAVAAKIMRRFPQVVIVAYGAIAAQVAWMLLWTVALVGVWTKAYDIHASSMELLSTATLNLSVFFMLLSLFWGLQVLRNIVHCTAAGAIGEWWFSPDTTHAVQRALQRATTTSFGSICFGSLIVATLSALQFVLLSAKRRKGRSTVNACLECLVTALETHLRAWNKYAYCQVALYGKDFQTAGTDTLQLFREKGWSGVVNDSLVSSVLSMGCLVVGTATGIVGVTWFYVATACSEAEMALHPAQCETFNVIMMTFVSCGAMGYAMCAVVSSILDSIVATIFVCFAEDPVALHITNSDEYIAIIDAWRQFHPELLTHSTFSASVSYA
ncbi:unnamed protein product [Aphanomyces euteiches]|uniref:Choline transporter-like protein n=1 Tax=Aphanomyces euteiches TaxID=100861 RepID=A0A6G0WLH4_9STRA|nr:hypothetical protein Ae201684_013994 [Aphanomyces euteiches]KAH9082875.1 hypothetical protein Ae201684P_013779 [Aphanomyces euteiches]